MNRFSNDLYNTLFTPEKAQFIKDYYMVFSDKAIGIELGIHKDIIFGYRMDVLKLCKRRHTRLNMNFRIELKNAKHELKALEAYSYSGIMQDSVNKRVEFLKLIIEGEKPN